MGTLGLGVAAAGLLFNPIVLWSEYTKFTTGAGLPEGPYGLLGAAEGIGYLVVLGIVGWSVRPIGCRASCTMLHTWSLCRRTPKCPLARGCQLDPAASWAQQRAFPTSPCLVVRIVCCVCVC